MGSACSADAVEEPDFPPAPEGAVGEWLRVLTVNDVYKLDNFPALATAIAKARAEAPPSCTVIATLNGDFLSPGLYTALDGGLTMVEAVQQVGFDYVCLGNHEFDVGIPQLAQKMQGYTGTVISTNIADDELAFSPHATIRLGGRTVVLAGLCTSDPSIYNPANLPNFTPNMESLARAWAATTTPAGGPPDALLLLTHQLVEEDRALAEQLGAHSTFGKRVPLMLGGHEHDRFVERVGGSLLLKMGSNAELIGVADVYFDAAGKPAAELRAELRPRSFRESPPLRAFVTRKERWVQGMMGAQLAWLDEPMSSNDVRHGPSLFASTLLWLVKAGLARNRVDVCITHGGSVRGKAEYAPGPFLMSHLYAELAFPTALAIVDMPGRVLAESVRWARARPKPAPEFLHLDLNVVVDRTSHAIKSVGGKPFSESVTYRVAITRVLLEGMNTIEPLVAYVAASKLQIPAEDSCVEAKNAVVEGAVKKAWLELAGYGSKWDCNQDGTVSPQEMTAALEAVFAQLDMNKDGTLDSDELLAAFRRGARAKKGSSGSASAVSLIAQMVKALDADHDGRISIAEFTKLAVSDSTIASTDRTSKAPHRTKRATCLA
ncbi:hypothetical protein KFE25_002130 [Diacronema lutheri]|uniref:EF-hand domain-containing protein n=2 Tax=Diacronema lutheri TaxID=2081491 RepID=A0A8J6CBA9_DIALT|nr:hypothetical protein KFE25_002130 [Diacronema lutheri]